MSARNSKNEGTLKEYILTGNIEISPGVHLISFNRDEKFIPGQVVKIGIDKESYTLCKIY